MILLDTCALLWLAADQDKLPAKSKQAIHENAGALFVSAISAFEIAVKCRNKKLKLSLSPLEWFNESLSFHGIEELPITGLIAVSSVELPRLHNDPCDRLIIATAQIHKMKILTSDDYIRQYSQAQVVWE